METNYDFQVGDRVEWNSYTSPPNGVGPSVWRRYSGVITALNSHRSSLVYHEVLPDRPFHRHGRADGKIEVIVSILRPANILDELARVLNG